MQGLTFEIRCVDFPRLRCPTADLAVFFIFLHDICAIIRRDKGSTIDERQTAVYIYERARHPHQIRQR